MIPTRARRFLEGRIGRARARAASLRKGVEIARGVYLGRGVELSCARGGRIVIGAGTVLVGRSQLLAQPGGTVLIGEHVFVASYCVVAASTTVAIGDGSMLAEFVAIRDHDHDPAYAPQSGRTLQAPVELGARVWVGAKASVGRGVTVGDDAVIAAHAFVSRSIPPDALAGGVPARVIRRGIRAPR